MAVAAAIYYNITISDPENNSFEKKKRKKEKRLKRAFSVKLVNGKPI
jgi:hypothetical protein